MMYKKTHITPSLINNIDNYNGSKYRGPLQHLVENTNIKPFTWCKDPEFLFATASIIGRGALVIFRCIIHRSSIQANTDYQFVANQNPIIGQPEWVVISNILVARYGLDRYEKYRTIRVLDELGLIDVHPDLSPKRAPVIRLAQGIMDYQTILSDQGLRQKLKLESRKIKKEYFGKDYDKE